MGAREVYLCEFERSTGARKIYSSLDKTNKVKTKEKKRSSLKFRRIFRPKSEFQTLFPAENRCPPKKRFLSQKFYEIRCESTKITKIRVANTNLSLDLHPSSADPVNFFGAQSSLGGAQLSFGGGHKHSFGGAQPRNAPPWRRPCIHRKRSNTCIPAHYAKASEQCLYTACSSTKMKQTQFVLKRVVIMLNLFFFSAHYHALLLRLFWMNMKTGRNGKSLLRAL